MTGQELMRHNGENHAFCVTVVWLFVTNGQVSVFHTLLICWDFTHNSFQYKKKVKTFFCVQDVPQAETPLLMKELSGD